MRPRCGEGEGHLPDHPTQGTLILSGRRSTNPHRHAGTCLCTSSRVSLLLPATGHHYLAFTCSSEPGSGTGYPVWKWLGTHMHTHTHTPILQNLSQVSFSLRLFQRISATGFKFF